jgi:hypothetical protein
MKVTQEQVNKYVDETLQPLADELAEYAKGKKIPAPDFYMACVGTTRAIVSNFGGRKAELLVDELNNILSVWATEELRSRLEEATTSPEETT